MAERRPFRIPAASPAAPRSDKTRAYPTPDTFIRRAQHGEGYLPTPAELTNERDHGHSPQIPWPADHPVDHKPFKNTKE
jgi:hypothetical protein